MITDKLINKVNAKIEVAESETQKTIKDKIDSLNEETETLVNDFKEEFELNKSKLLEEKANSYELLERQYTNKVQRETLDQLTLDCLEELNSLRGETLLTFIYCLIKCENVTGNEILMVPKSKFELFKEALCGNSLKCDLLNKKEKNYNFVLSCEDPSVKNGFLLVGEDFDLNFDFEELINESITDLEKTLTSKLFD